MATTQKEDGGIREFEREMATLRATYGAEALPIPYAEALKNVHTLKDKVVVVTGGSKGIGKEYAVKAASYGAKVVVSARGQSGIDQVVQEITKAGGQATGLVTDSVDWDAQVALFEHAVATFGPISVVVANAGIFEGGLFLDDKLDANGKLAKPDISSLDINVIGTTYTSKLAFHYLAKNEKEQHKSLVILGSLVSYIPSPSASLYVTSKHALLGLARALHLESVHGNKGIDVTLVASGPVPTDIFGDLKDMVAGLPHVPLSHTVTALLAASSLPSSASRSGPGRALATDNRGIFELPFKQTYAVTKPVYEEDLSKKTKEEKDEEEREFDAHPDVNVRPVRVGAGPDIEFVDRDQAKKDLEKEKTEAEK